MTDLREIKPRDRSREVREVLEHALSQADGLDGIIVLAVTKESQPWLRTSSISGFEKSYLVGFLNAVHVQHFIIRPTE